MLITTIPTDRKDLLRRLYRFVIENERSLREGNDGSNIAIQVSPDSVHVVDRDRELSALVRRNKPRIDAVHSIHIAYIELRGFLDYIGKVARNPGSAEYELMGGLIV